LIYPSKTAPSGPRSPRPDETRLASLMRLVSGGSEGALTEFFAETSGLVYTTVRRILRDSQRAEEVTLDVYMWVWERAKGYDAARGTVAAWLLTAARSRALDRLRRLEVRHRTEAEVARRHDAEPAESPAETLQHEELEAALSSLPDEQRRVIELAYFPGLTHVEIAERLGAPLGTVKTRIRLGMQKLRDTLSPETRS
jgi:RNA polymerase sigma-70 factor (ECF subfamily)